MCILVATFALYATHIEVVIQRQQLTPTAYGTIVVTIAGSCSNDVCTLTWNESNEIESHANHTSPYPHCQHLHLGTMLAETPGIPKAAAA